MDMKVSFAPFYFSPNANLKEAFQETQKICGFSGKITSEALSFAKLSALLS